ncbi:hypothetical protein [Peribacillus sp. SCS-37]|uniref:hypothetical protein n=1 Tax=Paraperibacillus esterisolvens TaxID=3115296 RepID=UPI0039058217
MRDFLREGKIISKWIAAKSGRESGTGETPQAKDEGLTVRAEKKRVPLAAIHIFNNSNNVCGHSMDEKQVSD